MAQPDKVPGRVHLDSAVLPARPVDHRDGEVPELDLLVADVRGMVVRMQCSGWRGNATLASTADAERLGSWGGVDEVQLVRLLTW